MRHKEEHLASYNLIYRDKADSGPVIIPYKGINRISITVYGIITELLSAEFLRTR